MVNKKAISPVVATALLLVVAVVAVVGFQGWFGSFMSGMQADTDKTASTATNGIKLDTGSRINDTTVRIYVKNNEPNSINFNVTVVGCGTNGGTVASDETEFVDVGGCTLTKGEKQVVLIVPGGQTEKKRMYFH